MSVELEKNISWKEAIEKINESGVLTAKIVERNIRKKKRKDEGLKGDTLFIKKASPDAKTVYRKNIKEEQDEFLGKEVNINVIDRININIASLSTDK